MMKPTIFATVLSVAAVGKDRQTILREIRDTPNVLWKASETPVRKFVAGVSPEAMAERKRFAESNTLKASSHATVPDSFDSETHWPECAKVIGDIRDQSNCGCCWAFAAASAASDRLCISTNAKIMVPLSAQDVCFCASHDGCNGGDIETPWFHIQSQGAVSGGQFNGTGPFGGGFCADFSLPHCHHHGPQGSDPYPAEGQPGCPSASSPMCPSSCDSTAKAPHDVFQSDKYKFQGLVGYASSAALISEAIVAGGPVETAFLVREDFSHYVSGIYHHVTGDIEGGHAVRIVGFGVENGVKYWKIANSWNPYWGEKGYFRIKRGTNECNIEDKVTFSPPDAIWTKDVPTSDVVV